MSISEDHSLDPEKHSIAPTSNNGDDSEKVQPPAFGGEPANPSNISTPISTIPYGQRPDVPEDLRISWSWVHFLCFLLFGTVSFFLVPTIIAIPFLPQERLAPQELQQYLLGIPQFVIAASITIVAMVLLFLYVTVSVLPGEPFWSNLGWRKLRSTNSHFYSRPWFFVLLGAFLSLIVSLAGSQVQIPKDMPVEALMKSRMGFILMMSMGVAVAPLAEETIFRGYLYPLLVRLISTSGQHFGASPANATRVGINTSIIVTGILFGLLHGQQLSWTWGIVSLLIVVGIVFTFVRARMGSVFASFLMHFGYNLFLALVSLIETHGLKNLPPQ